MGHSSLFYYFLKNWNVESWRDHSIQNEAQHHDQTHAFFSHLQVFSIATMDLVIISIAEKDPMSNEEALIDRYSYVFDTEVTISPISVSKDNMSENVGKKTPFLEAV